MSRPVGSDRGDRGDVLLELVEMTTAATLGLHDQRADRGDAQLRLELGRPEERAERDEHRADAHHRDGVDRPLDAVRHEQPDPRALVDPGSQERPSDAPAVGVELAIGHRRLVLDDHVPVLVAHTPRPDQGGDGHEVRWISLHRVSRVDVTGPSGAATPAAMPSGRRRSPASSPRRRSRRPWTTTPSTRSDRRSTRG